MDELKTQKFTEQQLKDFIQGKEVLTHEEIKEGEHLIELPREESFIVQELDNPEKHRLGDCINLGCGNKHYKVSARVIDVVQAVMKKEINNIIAYFAKIYLVTLIQFHMGEQKLSLYWLGLRK